VRGSMRSEFDGRDERLAAVHAQLGELAKGADGKAGFKKSEMAFGRSAVGVESSVDLTEADMTSKSPGTLADEYLYVDTFKAGDLDLKKIVAGTPSDAMIGMVQGGPERGPAIPADWKAWKAGKPVDIPAMLGSLGDIFASDPKTLAVISDLKHRYAAAQAQMAEAMEMPEQPDWKQLSAVGPAYAEFLGEVKKVYDAEAGLKRPSDADLLKESEAAFKGEHAEAAALQKEFWQAQDDVLGAVAHGLFEIGEAEDLYERVERDEPVLVDEVLIRKPEAMAQIDREISDFQFSAETEAKLVNVDMAPLEGFYGTLMKAVKAKAATA